jgi:hypothetical protein
MVEEEFLNKKVSTCAIAMYDLQNQFQCFCSFYFYLCNCAKNERILEASLKISTFVFFAHRWRLKIYGSLWRRCNMRLQRWKEKEEPHHKWKIVSVKGCSSWKICRSCTSVAWRRCATMFSTSSSFFWLSCLVMFFVVSLLTHVFHHVLGCVNMELSSLFFILCNRLLWYYDKYTKKDAHGKPILFGAKVKI